MISGEHVTKVMNVPTTLTQMMKLIIHRRKPNKDRGKIIANFCAAQNEDMHSFIQDLKYDLDDEVVILGLQIIQCYKAIKIICISFLSTKLNLKE